MLMYYRPPEYWAKGEPQNVLDGYLEMKEEYKGAQERLRSLRNMMERYPSYDEETVDREDRAEMEIVCRCLEIEEILEKADKMMKALPKALRVILHDRYITGLPWNEIAEKHNYSLDYCYALHRKAIRHLEGGMI